MEKIFEVIGYNGSYQKYLLIINLITDTLPIIYPLQIAFLIKYPSFLVKKLQSDDPNKIYEMEFSDELCNKDLYSIEKNPLKSVINWCYTFELYCDRDKYNVVLTSIIFIGSMLGTLFVSPLPDRYGRSIFMKVISVLSLFFHINLLLANSIFHLIVINFLAGMTTSVIAVGFSLFTEFFPKKNNGFIKGIYNAVYSVFGIFLAFFFYVSPNWRYLYVLTVAIHIFYTYYILKYFIESPRWLHSMGEKEKCLTAITEVAIFNNTIDNWNKFKSNNSDFINKIGTQFLDENNPTNKNNMIKNKSKKYNIFDILKFKSQRILFVKITLIFICSSFAYYGIILNLGRMEGNFFINAVFAFLGETVAETTFGILADKFGRIKTFQFACILGAVGYTIFLLVPVTLKAVFLFVSMLGFSGLWTVTTIYTPEVYPTKIRNIAFAYSGFISRLSPICVPILSKEFGKLIGIAFVLCGVIPFLIVLFLEETLGKAIMDIIPEELGMNNDENDIKMNFINEMEKN